MLVPMPAVPDERSHIVRSVSLAFDEDSVDDVIEMMEAQVEMSPRPYLARLATENPTGAQVNFESGPSLRLDPTQSGLTMLAYYMEEIAPMWTAAWYVDFVILRPAPSAEAP